LPSNPSKQILLLNVFNNEGAFYTGNATPIQQKLAFWAIFLRSAQNDCIIFERATLAELIKSLGDIEHTYNISIT
jgi:hypothetical protein